MVGTCEPLVSGPLFAILRHVPHSVAMRKCFPHSSKKLAGVAGSGGVRGTQRHHTSPREGYAPQHAAR